MQLMRPQRVRLINSYGLSEAQADAILQMQLRRLTAWKQKNSRNDALQAQIADLQDILARRASWKY